MVKDGKQFFNAASCVHEHTAKRNAKVRCTLDFIIGFCMVAALIVIFWGYGVNSIEHGLICFDEGYNATVAANFSKYGEYRISYPAETVFPNRITTGAAVIIPTSILYSLFGINNLTSNIVALVYGVFDIALLWLLFLKGFGKRKFRFSFTAAMVWGAILADTLFGYICIHLIGESAAIFFLLLCFLFLTYYYEKEKRVFMVLSGAALAGGFLTKSSMIFFVVTVFGVLLIEALFTRTLKWKEVFFFLAGFGVGVIILDAIKYIQLGGMLQYLRWWRAEWENMLQQSSGVDIHYSISEKINSLEGLFGANQYVCLVMTAVPVVMYGVHVLYRLCTKGSLFEKKYLGILLGGLGGSSLIVYFIFLGGKGLVYGRRLCVNSFFIRCSVTFFVGVLIWTFGKSCLECIGKKGLARLLKNGVLLAAAFVICSLVFGKEQMKNNMESYLTRKTEDDYEYQLMQCFLEEVEALPENATLYCNGWWQEPDITLFTDRKMTDISSVEKSAIDKENGYFLIGRRFDGRHSWKVAKKYKLKLQEVDNIEVDYSRIAGYNSDELFTIFKIN